MDYKAPLKDIIFTLNEVAGLSSVGELPQFEDATPDLVEAIVTEAATFASEVVGPTNRIGDTNGPKLVDGAVSVPSSFAAAFEQFVDNGWPGIAMSAEFGGQGMPHLVGTAVEEMTVSANMAWSLCGMLTQSAVRAVEAHASEELKAVYLEKMITCAWTGTMNLTEPQAGSDLAAVRTQAEPDGDAYRITGQKIYITWGDHDMADNIIHLVLARLPDAPAGVKGISLFLVPKFLVDSEGNPGEANSLGVVSIEHKLGINGSPTCVMQFDGALGYLVGEPNRGLPHMFTMMNLARIAVGLEGLAIAERAYQQAVQFAGDRIQGTKPGHEGRVAIIQHPDVRRMLMTMKTHVAAMRGLVYSTSTSLDLSHGHADADVREYNERRVDVLTPIVKGWCTEIGQWVTSVAVQVHGGMGFVEETGAAQHYRDSRITTIYEGTTGIQAGDLVGRKLLRDSGKGLGELIEEMRSIDDGLAAIADLQDFRAELTRAVDALEASVAWILANYAEDPDVPGAASFSLLMLAGYVCGGWQLGKAALAADAVLKAGTSDGPFYEGRKTLARFYSDHVLPQAQALAASVQAGCESTMSLPLEQF